MTFNVMPTAADFNSFVHLRMTGAVLGPRQSATVDGPVLVTVTPSARVSAVLVDGEDVPVSSPVVLAPGATFSIGAGQRGMLTTHDPWTASVAFAWG